MKHLNKIIKNTINLMDTQTYSIFVEYIKLESQNKYYLLSKKYSIGAEIPNIL